MKSPLDWLSAELAEFDDQRLLRRRRRVVPLREGWCEVDGRRLRNFATNDYLGLAGHPSVVAAARRVLDEAGAGSRASALVAGRTVWHARLEEKLAEFEEQDGAILFPSGYAANVGTISALVDKRDIVFSDRLNHASLIDGCRLTGATIRVYRHNALDGLRRALEQSAGYRRRLIVTDSLFSMDGVMAPLPDLCQLKEQHGAMLLIDEAHATGVFGRKGRGVAEHFDVESRVDVRIGTLSKSIGALGGFATGPHALIDWLWNRARTQVFSTALPPAVCAAACAAVDLIRTEADRREKVLRLSSKLRRGMHEAGIATVAGGSGPIVPVLLDTPSAAISTAAAMEDRGFFVAAIRPPSVPEGTSRVRITVTAEHDDEGVEGLVGALGEAVPGPCKPHAGSVP